MVVEVSYHALQDDFFTLCYITLLSLLLSQLLLSLWLELRGRDDVWHEQCVDGIGSSGLHEYTGVYRQNYWHWSYSVRHSTSITTQGSSGPQRWPAFEAGLFCLISVYATTSISTSMDIQYSMLQLTPTVMDWSFVVQTIDILSSTSNTCQLNFSKATRAEANVS